MTRKKDSVSLRRMISDWNQLAEGGLLIEAPPEDDEDEGGDEEEGEGGDEDEEAPEEPEAPEEDPEPDVDEPHEETPEDSLDNQIDALLIGFESDSVEEDGADYDSPVGESRRRRVNYSSSALMKTYAHLFEAPEDEEDEEGDEETTDNTELQTGDAVDPDAPKLNLDAFAQRVARLVNNHDSMLDVPAAILDRTLKFVRDNYDDATADELEEIMAQQHDIQKDEIDEEYPEYGPPAAGAEGVPSAGGGGFDAGGGDLGGGEV